MLKHIFLAIGSPLSSFRLTGTALNQSEPGRRRIRDFLVLVLSENELKIKIASYAGFSEFLNF